MPFYNKSNKRPADTMRHGYAYGKATAGVE